MKSLRALPLAASGRTIAVLPADILALCTAQGQAYPDVVSAVVHGNCIECILLAIMKGEIHMDDKIKNKEQVLEHEQKTEKSKDEVREISD